MCLLLVIKGRSGFQRLCFEVRNEDGGLKSLKICKAGMPSISIIPNKNVKWTETTMVSGCLQLTVIAIFWVMGKAFPLVQVKYNALPTLGINVFNSPAVPCPFSVAAIKNQSTQSQNVVHSSPIPFPVTVFPASPEEHVTMVTNPFWCTDQVSLSGRIASRATWNQNPQWNHQKPRPLFLSGVSQYRAEGYLSCSRTLKVGNSRMPFRKSYQCLPVIITMNSSSHFN